MGPAEAGAVAITLAGVPIQLALRAAEAVRVLPAANSDQSPHPLA